MVHSLTIEEMKKLEQNQQEFSYMPPVTYMATFKISSIESLISEIKKSPEFIQEHDFTHNICISFVRMEIQENQLGFYWKNKGHTDNSQSNGRKTCTQIIPIITGCIAELDKNDFTTSNFKYLTVNGKIPFARPGGEGSGLIPPPPPTPGGKQ
jgi:hypothetical protein